MTEIDTSNSIGAAVGMSKEFGVQSEAVILY